jgi:ATP-dependent phosphoenolpyruvate carboxykinase
MVQHPHFFADLLTKRAEGSRVGCWLLNTGWVGGPYGVGKRISIRYTRALLGAALGGSLHEPLPAARRAIRRELQEVRGRVRPRGDRGGTEALIR